MSAYNFKMRIFKVGLIGCGKIGSLYDENGSPEATYTHAGMYARTDGFTLSALAESVEERRIAAAARWGVKNAYPGYREMLAAEQPDVVSIATPDETHAAILADVIEGYFPKVIFTEKPLANDAATAIALLEKARARGTAIVVDYVRRWDDNHIGIRDFLRAGNLGEVTHVVCGYVRGLRHNGCQMLHMLQFLFGPITEVQSFGNADGGSFAGDPSINFRAVTASGATATVLAMDQKGYAFSFYELDIFGTGGRLRMLNGGQRFERYLTEEDPQFAGFRRLTPASSPWEVSTYGKALLNTGRDLYALANGGHTSHPSAADAVRDLLAIEAVQRSAQGGHMPVRISPYPAEE